MGGAVGPGKLTAGDDVLILEDEKARMVLRGTDALIGRITTGAARPPQHPQHDPPFARTSLLSAWTTCSHRIPRGTDALIGCATTGAVAVCPEGHCDHIAPHLVAHMHRCSTAMNGCRKGGLPQHAPDRCSH